MDASQVVGPIPQRTIDHVGDYGDAVNPSNSVMVLGPGPVPMTVSVSREMFEAQPRRVNEGTEIGLRLLGAGLGGELGREIEGMADEIAAENRLGSSTCVVVVVVIVRVRVCACALASVCLCVCVPSERRGKR